MYRLGSVGTGTLSHDLKRWYYRMRGWEDPYLKIGEASNISTKGDSEYVWALKDINLEVMPGEVLGIIGKNGAGKSTLLKILSKVTGPTTGSIDYNGRVGALLEVGTGFHQELTGRENIFLNGAILGMTKAEIRGKLDEIIDFSGVERYIDTPVKRYSSGMMVRLGFAVAAHLEPEILIVDEVLAVGDAEFQKKAIGKMQDVSKEDGRTVLFVSHNLDSIQQLCTKAILMRNAMLFMEGDTSSVVEEYKRIIETDKEINRVGTKQVFFESYFIEQKIIGLTDELVVKFKLSFNEKVDKFDISLDIRNENFEFIAHLNNQDDGFYIDNLMNKGNDVEIKVRIKEINLAPGTYYISLWTGDHYGQWFDYIENCMKFSVEQGHKLIKRPYPYDRRAKVALASTWTKGKLK